jgi:hypothetical protein
MSLNPSTGEFTWTPAETQDGSYTVVFAVSDGFDGEDTEAVVITIGEVNRDPVLVSPGDQAVAEGSELSFTIGASDDDRVNPGEVGNTLSFAIVAGAQAGMSLDSATGEFSWTPGEAQNGEYDVTFRVTDGANGFADVTVTITVSEVNTTPTLDEIGEQTIDEGSPAAFVAAGDDTDLVGGAANDLTYSLVDAPTGAGIDPESGAFAWTPLDDGVYTFTVRVTDADGLSADRDVTITVDNVAPTAILDGGDVTYGDAVTVDFADAYDPSGADTAAGFRYAYAPNASDLDAATYDTSGDGASASFGLLGAGEHTIHGRIIDKDGGYTQYSTTVTVFARAITISADAQFKTYGDADPTLTYRITAGSVVESDAFTGELTRAAGEDAGTYAIGRGTLDLGDNYALAYVGADLIITRRAMTVTADASSKTYGESDPVLTYQITSGDLVGDDAFTGALIRHAGRMSARIRSCRVGWR